MGSDQRVGPFPPQVPQPQAAHWGAGGVTVEPTGMWGARMDTPRLSLGYVEVKRLGQGRKETGWGRGDVGPAQEEEVS